jgi:hypothetical protein
VGGLRHSGSLNDAGTYLQTVDRATDPEPLTELTRLLSRALRALSGAGRPVDASRLAVTGWSTPRDSWPVEADGLLHYLARLPIAHADTQLDALTIGNTMTGEDQQLDVRLEIPARRHELIFDTHAKLDMGDNFVLVNDQAPSRCTSSSLPNIPAILRGIRSRRTRGCGGCALAASRQQMRKPANDAIA